MTEKQLIKSIEKKMERIRNNNPDVDFDVSLQKFYDIERYYKLSREHFFLKFKIEHCDKCGKKL